MSDRRKSLKIEQRIVACFGCFAAIFLAFSTDVIHAQVIEFKQIRPRLEDFGYINRHFLWNQKIIPVCFENPSTSQREDLLAVESAVEQSWEAVSGIQFTGWLKCQMDSRGIRILISDDDSAPHSLYGKSLDGVPNGMKLNLTFKNWAKEGCAGRERGCLISIAVHEFGHALGFLHESLRVDAPEECKKQANVLADKSGLPNSEVTTPYDPQSVMNYCNLLLNVDGKLSALDIEAIKILYPR